MSKLAISTIIPTYNRAHLLDRSISSALQQLEAEDEIVIVDDGSTDHTEKVVSKYGERVRYIRTPNRGVGAARNSGVKEARNPLVAFLDSDDEWMPGKIQLQRNFMQAEPNILFCFSNFAFKESKEVGGREKRFNLIRWHKDSRSWDEILGPGKRLSSIISLPDGMKDFNYHVGDLYILQLTAQYVNVNTLLVRRIEAGDALHFAEDGRNWDENECVARMARIGKCAYLDLETSWQHSHGGPRITDGTAFEDAGYRIPIIKRIWGSDKDFLKEHSELYQSTLNEQRLIRAEGLLIRGRTKEAREEFKTIPDSPLSYRILASIPGSIVKSLLFLRRTLKPIGR